MDIDRFKTLCETYPFLYQCVPSPPIYFTYEPAEILACEKIEEHHLTDAVLWSIPRSHQQIDEDRRKRIHMCEMWHFVRDDHTVTRDAVPQELRTFFVSGIHAGRSNFSEGTTLIEALEGKNAIYWARPVEWVVRTDVGYRAEDGQSLPGWRATIYRLPEVLPKNPYTVWGRQHV